MAEQSDTLTNLQERLIEDTISCDTVNQVIVESFPGGVEVVVSLDWLRRGRPRRTRQFDKARVFTSFEDAIPFINESLAWVRPDVGPPSRTED